MSPPLCDTTSFGAFHPGRLRKNLLEETLDTSNHGLSETILCWTERRFSDELFLAKDDQVTFPMGKPRVDVS
jgi:hypothetical protein